jgi:pyrimidine oxygenase
MDVGVFIPIGNNGWIISATSPQYMPTFDLNRTVVQKAERCGLDFALSMIKLGTAARRNTGTTISNPSR